MSYLTEIEITDLQLSALDRGTPFLIQGVSTSQLSVARHYGACKFQGKDYFYIAETDELIRDDVLAWVAKQRKVEKKAESAARGVQETLL